jgi:hypothetical protein
MEHPVLRWNRRRDRQLLLFRLLAQIYQRRKQIRRLPYLDDGNLERRGEECDALGLDAQHGHSTGPSFDDRLDCVEGRTRIEPGQRHVSAGRVRDRKRRQSLPKNPLHLPVDLTHGRPGAQDDKPLPVQCPDVRGIVNEWLIGHDMTSCVQSQARDSISVQPVPLHLLQPGGGSVCHGSHGPSR